MTSGIVRFSHPSALFEAGWRPVAFACVVLSLFAREAAAAEPSFTSPFRPYDIPGSPQSVAIADFDLDGLADVVVAHSSGITMLHGRGDGSLGPALAGSGGGKPLTSADIDADGKRDLVFIQGGLCVQRGRGDGTFLPSICYHVDTDPFEPPHETETAFALGDLDADGDLDAVVTSITDQVGGGLFVLRGTSSGFVPISTRYEIGSSPQAVVLADFDGDLRLDVATANYGAESVTIYSGNGDGTFGARADLASPNTPLDITAADFDADGRIDLVTVHDSVGWFRGRGDGTFDPVVQLPVVGFKSLATDVNRDGRADLLVVPNGDAAAVLLGKSTGSFDRVADAAAGSQPRSAAAGDLNGDGAADLVVVAHVSQTVSVHLGNGDGTFGSHTRLPTGQFPKSVEIADLDRDGAADLISANGNSGTISVWLGRNNATFEPRRDFAANSYPSSPSLELGDFDHDGAPDAVVPIQTHAFSFFPGDGSGGFGAAIRIATGPAPNAVAAGDLNEDGDLDLASTNQSGWSIHLGNGDRTFRPRTDFYTPQLEPRSLVITELNGDSHPDFVYAHLLYASLAVQLGRGDGTFHLPVTIPTGLRTGTVVAADVNGDGAVDLVATNDNSNDLNSVAVLLGSGTGTFGPPLVHGVGRDPDDIEISDVDRDQRPDLVVSNFYSNTISVLMGNGDGTFTPRVDFGTGSAPYSVAAGDLSGDGLPDVVVADAWSNTLSLLWNRMSPVPVLFSDLVALATEPGVRLDWRLALQDAPDLTGVRVLRAESENGPYTERTPEWLAPASEMSFEDGDVAPDHEYWYRIEVVSRAGAVAARASISIRIEVGQPASTRLHPLAVPRAGAPVRVTYSLATPVSRVLLALYDVRGRLIRDLDRGLRPAGEHTILWDRRTVGGAPVARGVYIVRLDAGHASSQRKLVLFN